jgi:hypothetical protein
VLAASAGAERWRDAIVDAVIDARLPHGLRALDLKCAS